MDDDELIQAARDNEPWAAPFLVSLYGPRLAGYCRNIASDLSDTDRNLVTANAIERAVRRIDTYDPALGSLLAWLRPFVRHAAQDWRRANAYLADIEEHREIPADPESGLEAEPNPVNSEMVEAVREALPQLSDPDQIILVLRHYEGLTPQHIARTLGINDDACRQRLHRAHRRLRDLLSTDPRITPISGDNP